MACWVQICQGCWWLRPSAELVSSGSGDRGPPVIVVDTNVVAYLLLSGLHTALAITAVMGGLIGQSAGLPFSRQVLGSWQVGWSH